MDEYTCQEEIHVRYTCMMVGQAGRPLGWNLHDQYHSLVYTRDGASKHGTACGGSGVCEVPGNEMYAAIHIISENTCIRYRYAGLSGEALGGPCKTVGTLSHV